MRPWVGQRGSALVLVAAALPLVVALMGLLLDGGMVIYGQFRIQGAVRSASRAATSAYDSDIWQKDGLVVIDLAAARFQAQKYLRVNEPAASLGDVSLVSGYTNRVSVTATLTVPHFFMKIFGETETRVSATTEASRG